MPNLHRYKRKGESVSIKDEMEAELRGTTVRGTLQHFLDNCDNYEDVIVIARTPEDTVFTAFSSDSYPLVLGMLEYGKKGVWDDQFADYPDERDDQLNN